MDLLSVLDQRSREQTSEARQAKFVFWWWNCYALMFLILGIATSPVMHPSISNTFIGTVTSMVYLFAMAGVYISMVRGAHSLTALRLPSSYNIMSSSSLQFLLPRTEHKHLEYSFYTSFAVGCCLGFSVDFRLLFLSCVAGLCVCYSLFCSRF